MVTTTGMNGREVPIDADPTAFGLVLEFIYTARVELSGANITSALHETAKRFGVIALREACGEYLRHHHHNSSRAASPVMNQGPPVSQAPGSSGPPGYPRGMHMPNNRGFHNVSPVPMDPMVMGSHPPFPYGYVMPEHYQSQQQQQHVQQIGKGSGKPQQMVKGDENKDEVVARGKKRTVGSMNSIGGSGASPRQKKKTKLGDFDVVAHFCIEKGVHDECQIKEKHYHCRKCTRVFIKKDERLMKHQLSHERLAMTSPQNVSDSESGHRDKIRRTISPSPMASDSTRHTGENIVAQVGNMVTPNVSDDSNNVENANAPSIKMDGGKTNHEDGLVAAEVKNCSDESGGHADNASSRAPSAVAEDLSADVKKSRNEVVHLQTFVPVQPHFKEDVIAPPAAAVPVPMRKNSNVSARKGTESASDEENGYSQKLPGQSANLNNFAQALTELSEKLNNGNNKCGVSTPTGTSPLSPLDNLKKKLEDSQTPLTTVPVKQTNDLSTA